MVASVKPYRDELGVGDGRLLVDGSWTAGSSGESEPVSVPGPSA
jgi:hypothetical protein